MQQSTRISPDLAIDTNALRQLIARNEESALSRLISDTNYRKESIVSYFSEGVKTRLSNGAVTEIVWSADQDRPTGIVMAEDSKWDTEHFARKIGRITLALFDEVVSQERRIEALEKVRNLVRAEMLSARINLRDPRTIHALEAIGAILTDVLLTYRFDLTNHPPLDYAPKVEIELARKEEAEELGRIGGSVFAIDRFHNDPQLSTKGDLLYSKWVVNSVNGFADAVLVAKDHNKIAGFITCKLDQIDSERRSGTIDLIGVHKEFAGRGIGSDLVQAALRWFAGRVSSVYVGTQAANARAVRLYEKSRFTHVCSEATFHLWSDPESKS